jgi:hypothetical protein
LGGLGRVLDELLEELTNLPSTSTAVITLKLEESWAHNLRVVPDVMQTRRQGSMELHQASTSGLIIYHNCSVPMLDILGR